MAETHPPHAPASSPMPLIALTSPDLPLQAAAAPSPQPSQTIWRVSFFSKSACDRHGNHRRKAEAGSCALARGTRPPSSLSFRLAALTEMETLASHHHNTAHFQEEGETPS